MAYEAYIPYGGRAARSLELSPADEEALVASLGRKALSGLAFAGNVLDTPGGIARDILAGKNPLPNIFNPEGRTTGRELLQKAGIVSANRPGLDTGDVGGLAAEIALDPLTYLSLGGSAVGKFAKAMKTAGVALPKTRVARMTTKAGDVFSKLAPEQAAKVSERAGKMGIDITKRMEEPIGSLVGIGLPFQDAAFTVGHGPVSQKIAGALDKIGAAARYSAPGRIASSLFNSELQGATSKRGQQAFEAISHATEPRSREAESLVGRAAELQRRHGISDEELRRIFETQAEVGNQGHKELSQLINPQLQTMLTEKQQHHIPISSLEDELGAYFPRKMSIAPNQQEAISARLNVSPIALSTRHGAQIQRLESLKGVVGSTQQIQAMAKDPIVNDAIEAMNAGMKGFTPKNVGKILANKFPGVFENQKFFNAKLDNAMGRAMLEPDPAKSLAIIKKLGTPAEHHATEFAKVLADIYPEVRQAGIFGNTPLADLAQHFRQGIRAIENKKGAINAIVQPGALLDPGGARHFEGEKLWKVLKTLGIKTRGGVDEVASRLGIDFAAMKPKEAAKAYKAFANRRVEPGLARDLMRPFERVNMPEAAGTALGAFDTASNLIKSMLTGVWPAFHVRNLASGQVQNILNGSFSPNDVAAVHGMLKGGSIKGIADVPAIRAELAKRGLQGDEAGTDVFRQILRSHELVGKYQGEWANVLGRNEPGSMLKQKTAADLAQEFPGGLGGSNPIRYKEVGKRAIGQAEGTSLRPWQVRGVGTRTESAFGPAAAGEDLGYLVETLNRASPFLTMLKRGVDPQEASKLINAAHVSYGARHFTPFENAVMQRLFPFYKFQKGQAKYVFKELTEHPGGRLAQAVRATNAGHDRGELVPEAVSGSSAIRIPPGASGQPRYLTSLGLMHEDPLQFAANPIPGSGGPQAIALELLSRLNPPLKGALEAAMGQSLFQRSAVGPRPLEDLDPVIGRLAANLAGRETAFEFPGERVIDPLLTNSPASRALTSLRTLTDPRKGIAAKAANLLSGLRITDVPEKTQDALLRALMQQKLRELPNSRQFLDVYVPKDILAQMPPAQQQRALAARAVLSQLDRRARERAKERLQRIPVGASSL